jgi:Ca2+-binding RTX toxin-like protein
VAQGSATYHETFSIITGTSSGDTFNGTVTNGDDVIYGLQSGGANGVDVILAGTGNDTVFGQDKKDEIHGGEGSDVLYGGGGNDTFVFDTALNAATNVDLIADFASGSDKIGLSNASGLFDQIATGPLAATAFDIIGDATAATGATRIAYDPSTGALYYDADGSSAGAAIQFATLGSASHPTISATDFVIGNPPPGA